MNKRLFLRLAAICWITFRALCDEPTARLNLAGPGEPLTLIVDASGDLVVQESSDLRDWRPFVTVFSEIQHYRLIDRTLAARSQSVRLLSIFGQVNSPEQMAALWQSSGIKAYRFSEVRTCSCQPTTLSATVTVRNGQVVAVDDVKDSGGGPIPNPDLAQFESIKELFQLVAAKRGHANLVEIATDEVLHAPTWIHIDPDYGITDDEITYQISGIAPID